MDDKNLNWEILGNPKRGASQKLKKEDIIHLLLKNRGIRGVRQEKEFFKPTPPEKIQPEELGISQKSLDKAIKRIRHALKDSQGILIYGDYDADGVCATAILWESLYSMSKEVTPYIPDRFSEGYGLNLETIAKIKKENPKIKLIISVDNGIVAYDAVDKAKDLGIDVIISDHHQKGKKIPKAYSILHTTEISGSAIAFILANEIRKKLKNYMVSKPRFGNGIDLVAIGTVADQMPLVKSNRSFAKYGLEGLRNTLRPGLKALYQVAGIVPKNIGTYEINYMIAPRINAMGRIKHAIDSLRLICTLDEDKAQRLALLLNKTNVLRQKVVDKVVLHAKEYLQNENTEDIIVLADESYHEGVIGLAAAKLVEEFYRPSIVLSKGEKISKASARSISGFDIISVIRSLEELILGGGGHSMAAGFSIETTKIEEFKRRIVEVSKPLLTSEVLTKKIRIDLELDFENLSLDLYNSLLDFEPTGIGNPTPTFLTRDVSILDAKVVGLEAKHLRLKLEKNGSILDAIAFNMGNIYASLSPDIKIDIVYNLSKNVWNGYENLELKIKDVKLH